MILKNELFVLLVGLIFSIIDSVKYYQEGKLNE